MLARPRPLSVRSYIRHHCEVLDSGALEMVRSAILFSAAITITALIPVSHATAAQVTGQQLWSLCTANMWGKGNPLEAAQCMGYVVGVADTFSCTQSNHGFTWNNDPTVSQPKLVALVVNWLSQHPAALSYEAHRVVGAALQDAFPCKVASN